MNDDKIFFLPGDIVTLRLNIPNKPTMIVVKKVTNIFKHEEDKEGILRGILCMWFTQDGTYLEKVFNTKDLIKWQG